MLVHDWYQDAYRERWMADIKPWMRPKDTWKVKPKYTHSSILMMVRAGRTVRDIGEYYGIAPHVVRAVIRRYE